MIEIHDSEFVLVVIFPIFLTCLTIYLTPEGYVRCLASVWIHSSIHELFHRPTIVLNTGKDMVMTGLSESIISLGDRSNWEAYNSDVLREKEIDM